MGESIHQNHHKGLIKVALASALAFGAYSQRKEIGKIADSVADGVQRCYIDVLTLREPDIYHNISKSYKEKQ